MSDNLDRLDQELREYGERWRTTIQATPMPDLSVFDRRTRGEDHPGASDDGPQRRQGLLVPVAAAAIALVILGFALVTGRGAEQDEKAADRTSPPPTSAEPVEPPEPESIVPWAPLDPTRPDIPSVTVPASPDPAAAADAPPCTGDDLRAVSEEGAAAGTAVLYLTIRPASPEVSCRLQGHPAVQFLDQGQLVDIPSETTPDDPTQQGPALVAEGNIVTLLLYWGSNWCTEPVHNDRIKVLLKEGSVEVDGFGRSPYCNGAPGSGPNSVRVGPFQPKSFRPAEVTSAYSGVDGDLTTLSDPVPGEKLRFLVTLTARRGDVWLDPCPDYSMVQQGSWDDQSVARFALNCAAVAYRDADGVPYLPHRVPVRFEMRLVLLGPDVEALKTTWSLNAPGAPALAIPTNGRDN